VLFGTRFLQSFKIIGGAPLVSATVFNSLVRGIHELTIPSSVIMLACLLTCQLACQPTECLSASTLPLLSKNCVALATESNIIIWVGCIGAQCILIG
jgi:hypothetical protein